MNEVKKVWIKNMSNNFEIILPVTPMIQFKESMNTDTQNLLGFGDVPGGKSPKLATWTCESLFPNKNNNYYFDVSDRKLSEHDYVYYFADWMNSKTILMFEYYSATLPIWTSLCQITNFSHGEKYGTGDIFYTLDFEEYKELKIDTQHVVYASNEDIIKRYGSDTYYVQEGDTLITIAAKVYGDSSKWSYLMGINGLQNPLNITVGQSLRITDGT